ncbi:MAG: serine/threonine-protein kinase [Dehalococcoidia bacterium]
MNATNYGRYRVVQELGRGAMAVVYLAEDTTLMRRVALKSLFPQHASNSGFRERFEREARILARVQHESIVPIFDFGEQDGIPFIVMEFMPGGTLATRIERGDLPTDEAIEILERVARGLDAAHAAGVIHRDLKPANILFDGKGRALVSDFGVGRMDGSSTGMTMPGTVIGTAQYMSPEQIDGAPPTPAADIYSFGVLAYETLCHRQPFAGDTVWAVMRKHREEVPPPPSMTDRRLAFADVPILQALQKDPAQRPPDASSITSRLREGLAHRDRTAAAPASSASRAAPTPSRARSGRLILGSAAAAFVIVGAGVGVGALALDGGEGAEIPSVSIVDTASPTAAAATATSATATATGSAAAQTPAATKSATGTVVIDERFDVPEGAVAPAEGRSGRGFTKDGVFVVEDYSAVDNQYPQSVLSAGGAQNHSISVDAFAPAATVLLTCRGSDRFEIRGLYRQSAGEVRIEVLDKGQAKITALRDWAPTTALRRDSSNRIELICEESRVYAVVNQVVAAEATVPGVEGAFVSFGIDGGASATFDNLEIRRD